MSQFQTNNQSYGSHYNKSSSVNKQRMANTTLDFLKQNDGNDFIHQQENVAQRSRHGLFTQPMTLATGDAYADKKPEKVQINVKVNTRLQEKVGPQLFEKMGSTNIGDLYKDSYKQKQLYNKQKNELSIHQRALIAGGKQRLVHNSQFQHKKQFEDKAYDTRNEEGQVKLGLKPFYTANMKKGKGNTTGGLLFGSYNYLGSPFDNPKQMLKNQKLQHKAKIPTPFSGATKPNQTFTPHHQAYHLQGQPYQQKNEDTLYRSKTTDKWRYNNPNKKGLNGTFTQFPTYVQQGQLAKQKLSHEKVWRPNYNGTSKNFIQTLSRPCPVPSQLLLNQIKRVKV